MSMNKKFKYIFFILIERTNGNLNMRVRRGKEEFLMVDIEVEVGFHHENYNVQTKL